MRNFIISLFLIFTAGASIAQEIRGVVINTNNQPIAQALIYSAGDQHHTHSDLLGKFTLNKVGIGDTIIASFLGFESYSKIITASDLEFPLEIKLEEKYFELEQVNITNSLKSISKVASIDLLTRPVKSSQEILTRVPGLFIAQHAGGGKAEQIFLRGFDIDHGTDIGIQVDGIPVNMVSHAHGQGYADLHFVIPETIENIDFSKGPYEAKAGNFSTAGHIDFRLKEQLDNSMFSIEAGAFNSRRILTMLDLMQDADDQSMYFAGEYQESDGPFESPQNFRRINLLGKYHRSFKDNSRLNVTLSRFSSNWDASGQIPNRLVANGQISRFGAVDDTEGGTTSRTNILLDHTKTIDNQSFIKTKGFYSLYDFTLFSNFTFFLENPGLGDQIRQKEKRSTIGLESVLYKSHSHASSNQELQIGLGFRYDDIKGSELSNTLQRTDILNRISFGDIDETNIYGFINWEYNKDRWLVNVGTRLDYFDFQYKDHLLPQYEVNSRNILRLSPKINFLYNPNRDLQLFMKSGIGFHSNDTRVIINREAEEILPAAYGLDLGSIWKPFKNLWISSTLWYLYLEQEFVYVGDAGIVEPSGESRRNGIELGIRYQVMRNLFLSTDLSYTIARSVDSPENENYIPLAPDFIATGNLVYKSGSGFRAGLQSRYIKDRPANEDNSIVALGYFLFNSNLGYDIGNLSFGIQLENILNTSWNESQFATTSRLMNEDRPVEELHFTPGNPRNVRGSIQYRF